jgi:hypothetical protein
VTLEPSVLIRGISRKNLFVRCNHFFHSPDACCPGSLTSDGGRDCKKVERTFVPLLTFVT